MIRYALKCARGHTFDSWFASSAAFERLRDAGQVACAICGDTTVDKALMAPARTGQQAPVATPAGDDGPARMLARLRAHLEAHSEDVGTRFASEARAIHDGDAPERQIHGQARPDEALALLEDGIPVLPLPLRPKRDVN